MQQFVCAQVHAAISVQVQLEGTATATAFMIFKSKNEITAAT
jgi:hypothetical protein